MKITKSNVDDFIRDGKRNGRKFFYWKGSDRVAFRYFARVIFHMNGHLLPHSFPNGDTFLGVKHFSK